jgi:hypothetical protein
MLEGAAALGPVREALLPHLPLSAVYRLGAVSTELRSVAETMLASRCAVTAVDVAAGEHVLALQQLLKPTGPADRRREHAIVQLATGTYRLPRPLSIRRKVHLQGSGTANTLLRQSQASVEGACVEVRASGVVLSELNVGATVGALRVHNWLQDVRAERCKLLGTVGVKKGAALELLGCSVEPPDHGQVLGWNLRHAVSVEGTIRMERCSVRDAGRRGVSASGRGASVTLTQTEIRGSDGHGVFADQGALVRLEGGTVVWRSGGCGACASGRRAVLQVVPPEPGSAGLASAAVSVRDNKGGAFWESEGGVIRGVERDRID